MPAPLVRKPAPNFLAYVWLREAMHFTTAIQNFGKHSLEQWITMVSNTVILHECISDKVEPLSSSVWCMSQIQYQNHWQGVIPQTSFPQCVACIAPDVMGLVRTFLHIRLQSILQVLLPCPRIKASVHCNSQPWPGIWVVTLRLGAGC